jgi:hypothetical protein
MVFTLAACEPEPDPDKDKDKVEIPAELQDTTWINSNGDTMFFDQNSVTITPKNGQPQKFTLKGTSSISQGGIEQTILYFKDKQSPDNTITWRNGSIASMTFSTIITEEKYRNSWTRGITKPSGLKILGSGTSGEFEYNYTATDIIITGYTGSGESFNIPATIDGKPVTYINDGSGTDNWSGNGVFTEKMLKSITIPNSVIYIGDFAFCNAIFKSYEIGNTFFISQITIPNSVTYIGTGAFLGVWMSEDSTLTIPNSVTYIGDRAFSGVGKLTTLIIGSGITTIGKNTFGGNLTSITIGADVTLDSDAFMDQGSHYSDGELSYKTGFVTAYNNAGKAAGTYTRPDVSTQTWTKQ